MFKVLIIDDEPIIRKGLKNIINWRQFDCEVCGEASDGVEGYSLIKELLPDIIITDIRMPEADGLTMIREVKEAVPESKIIILTGYRDFDYVQEAIKLGAFDFILKPSKIEELTAVIGKAVKEMKCHRDRSEEMNRFKTLFEQNMPVLREKLLYDVIYEINTNDSEIKAKMDLFGVKIDDFSLVVVETESDEEDNREMSQYDRHLYQYGIINTFEEVFSDMFSVTGVPLNDKEVGFIIQPKEGCDGSDEVIDRKCAYLQEIIRNCFGFTVTIAVSSEGKGIMQLPLKLKECREALEHKFYIGNSTIIFHNDINSFFRYEDYSVLEKYQKSLIEGIKSGNEKTVRSRLDDIYNFVEKVGGANGEYFKNFYWSTILSINNIRVSVAAADSGRKIESRDFSSLYKLIEECDSLKDLSSILREIALSVAAKVNSYNNKSIKLVLRKAVDYLQSHYSEQITLDEVAEQVYVSTYYLSRMFKRELGRNFVDYLNEIRIGKAKELLKDVKYKTYEVAEMVGIPDAHYFSRLFKKHEGVTPTEYRDTIK